MQINLKKRNGGIQSSLIDGYQRTTRNIFIVALIVIVIASTLVGFGYVRQANQVAQINELTGRLIHEQQKVQANEKELAILKAQVARQQAAIDELTKVNKRLTAENLNLTKKYRERREALEKKRLLASRGGNPIQLINSRENKKKSSVIAASIEDDKINEMPDFIGDVTFYTPRCAGCTGITASGVRATPGVTVAVDTRYWELGTEFYIEGIGRVVAQDTGGKIKGRNRIDVCVSSKSEALKLGRKKLKVWVYK